MKFEWIENRVWRIGFGIIFCVKVISKSINEILFINFYSIAFIVF